MNHGTWYALRRALRMLGRPVRVDAQKHGLVIHPYRGYGCSEQIFVIGRMLRQSGMERARRRTDNSWGYDLLAAARHLTRRGASGVRIAARFYGNETCTTSDRDGYFRVQMAPGSVPATDRLWHTLELEVLEPEAAAGLKGQAQVFIPPDSARFVVISDIDDTVMYTGVANKLMMLWRLFVQGASSRMAFPGVAAFYRALHQGISGNETNPMLYVSRGPWSLYEMLAAFFNIHGIPIGPLLFLREWGLTLQQPLPRQAKEHKLKLIRGMLALYKDLPFVLIGDSGQHDPETYARLISEYPGRVLAIYIRDISRTARRTRKINALAERVAAAGSTLLLAADTFRMAEHAAAHGLIAPAAVALVAAERRAQSAARQSSTQGLHGCQAEAGEATERDEQDNKTSVHYRSERDPPPDTEMESIGRQKKRSQGRR
ncbi:MAG TPA: phosphatase domain-containing protein [Nitrococcus sp.]|nr:phosphatase domain-containing protein [Nitrococcus sp.]